MAEPKTDEHYLIQKTKHDRAQNRNAKFKKSNMTEHKTDMNITKYKKLNMTEHKTDMTITKTDKYKKLSNNSMTEHKKDTLNTKTDHDRTQNRYEHY